MKNTSFLIFSVIIGVVFFQVLNFFGLPLWMILFSTPFLLYGQLYFSTRYNFRSSLQLEPIPEKGYEKRLSTLNSNEYQLRNLGFVKFDEFYLQISTDVVVYVYENPEKNLILCDYNFGSFNYIDLVSKYEEGYSLTTSNTENAGLIPRSDKTMLQVFLNHSLDELVARHLHTEGFLAQKGFIKDEFDLTYFREWFLSEYHKAGDVVNNTLGPAKSIYWMLSSNKMKYVKPVQEQFLAKTLQLPKN